MEETPNLHDDILNTLKEKSVMKQKVYDNTFAALNITKQALFDLSKDLQWWALGSMLVRRCALFGRVIIQATST